MCAHTAHVGGWSLRLRMTVTLLQRQLQADSARFRRLERRRANDHVLNGVSDRLEEGDLIVTLPAGSDLIDNMPQFDLNRCVHDDATLDRLDQVPGFVQDGFDRVDDDACPRDGGVRDLLHLWRVGADPVDVRSWLE